MSPRHLFLSALLALALPLAAADRAAVLDLAGTWMVRQADGGGAPIPMAIPGDVHSALLAAGRIPDPYFGRNEDQVQWVGEKEWIVERTIEVPEALLAKRSVTLRLEHVDTFCAVSVNGQAVGETGNRFRRYDFEVRPHLKVGANTITGLFRSAEKIGAERASRLPFPMPTNCLKNVHLVRKPACNGGWDWGISLMVAGFAGKTQLIGTDLARIDYVYSEQRHQPGRCVVAVTAEVTSPTGGATTLAVAIGDAKAQVPVTLVAGLNKVATEVVVERPRLWWPNGAGEQALYDMTVSVGDAVFKRRLGLRTIEVVNKPDPVGASVLLKINGKEVLNKHDAPGNSMTFRVNGTDIFCKGANWIPCDAMTARQTRERYRDLLGAAQTANMNMIRLWGGGQFEDDIFYETCDELGLLIWHDFMFSCSTYPSDDAFCAEVEAELAHQLRRLRDHASIALWCGDNECIGALTWYEESRRNRDRYLVNYDRLSRVLDQTITKYDVTRTFWPSSPCAGPGDFSDTWHSDSSGDMHYWTVWHENKDFSAFYNVKPRFCSEFGFQSFSSLAVARTFCPPDQLNPTAPDFEHHQKNTGGNARILETMARCFRFPEGMEHVLYLSQVQQALAIRTAVEAWRHLQPRCMGTLYWQLNDNWPVASWSSIEYGGKWKHLHHHARRFYAPVAVMVTPADKDNRTIEVWAVNDRNVSAKAEATIDLWSFAGRKLETLCLNDELPARSSTLLGRFPVARFGNDQQACERFLSIELVADLGGTVERHGNDWWLTTFKRCELGDANVTVTTAEKDGRWTATLATDKPALFVWAEVAGIPGEFDDNSFTLLPGKPVTLTFVPKAKATFADFVKNLSVTHLRKTYAGK